MSKISELTDGGSLLPTDDLIAVRSGANVKVKADNITVDRIDLGDNEKIRLGDSQDLEIYHSATDSIINDNGTGSLKLQQGGSTKLEVTTTGIDVTGTIVADGGELTGQSGVGSSTVLLNLKSDNSAGQAGNVLRFTDTDATATNNGEIGQIEFYNTQVGGVTAMIEGKHDTPTTGNMQFWTHDGTSLKRRIDIQDDGDVYIYATNGTSSNFRWDATNSRLGIGGINPSYPLDVFGAMRSYGAIFEGPVTINTYDLTLNGGTVTADGLTVDGNVSVDGGTIKLDGNYPVGTDNVALGNAALDSVESGGIWNTAIGANSLTATTTGDGNTGVGRIALQANTTGSDNTGLGYAALYQSTTASNNTAVGSLALGANTTGTSNVAVGHRALDANTTASNNTAVGKDALNANTTGSNNIAIGSNTLDANTVGSFNVGIGVSALGADSQGSRNVAVGHAALTSQNFTSPNNTYNTAVGFQTGLSVTTGTHNTLIGGLAGDALTTGSSNVAVGYNALSTDDVGQWNVAIGRDALASQNIVSAANTYNTAVGGSAGSAITTGLQNTAVGGLALNSNTTASSNTAVGYNALANATTGTQNTAIGAEAGDELTTSPNNVFVGMRAGNSVSTGDGRNVFVGFDAGRDVSTGSYNVLVGKDSGYLITTGSKNTVIGAYTGNNGGLDIRTANNHIVLSDGDGNPRAVWNNNGDMYQYATGSGIFLGGTAAGNKLDDYEEGTFTPSIDIEGGGTVSTSSSYGSYTKIGQQVIVHFGYAVTGTTGASASNALQFGSIPFAAKSGAVEGYPITIRLQSASSAVYAWYGRLYASLTTGRIEAYSTGGTSLINSSSYIGNGTKIDITIAFETTS